MQLSEGIFTRFFENSLEILCVLNSDWEFLKLNKMWQKHLGYAYTELEGKQFKDFVHPDDVSRTIKVTEKLQKKFEVNQFTNRVKNKNNTYIWLEWNFFLDGDTIFASARNMAKTAQKEEDYSKLINPHHTVLDTISVGLIYAKNSKFEWANKAFLEMFKCDIEDIIGQHLSLFYTDKNSYEKIHSEALQSFEKEETFYREIEVTNDDGNIQWINFTGKALSPKNPEKGTVWMVQDITKQKQNEKEINQLARLQQTILETLTVGISFVKDRKIQWCNKAHETIFGYAPGEMVNLPTSVLYHSVKEHERIEKEGYPILEKGEVYNTVFECLTKDGQTLWINLTGKAINKTEPSRGSIWMLKDITESIQNEVTLQMFKTSIDLANDEIYWINRDAEFEYVNQNACKSLGYTIEELNKLTLFDIDPLYNKEKWDKLWESYQSYKDKGGVGRQKESLHKRKDGSLYPTEVVINHIWLNGKELHIAYVRDITERKQNEEKLLKNQKILTESQRIANVGSWELNLKTNKVHWSRQTYDIFGITDYSTPITLDYFLQFVHPNDRDYVMQILEESLETKLFKKFECRIIRTNNKIITVLGEGELLFDEDGNVTQILGAVQDITERKQAEEEIKKLNSELEQRVTERTSQLNKVNKELEAFAYSVSHDLRAPIRHIDGFLSLMYSNISNPTEYVKTYYQKISSASKRMSVMIDGLLKFSHLGRVNINFAPVNTANLINEIIEQLKPDYSERKIKWDIKDLPVVSGDSTLLRLAFENIISNSIKYTAEKEQAEIEIGVCSKQNNTVCIFIKDNGIGFDMAYKEKLFGVFQRLHSDNEFKGIGIGLANAKQIILKHNGKIDAVSEVNRGTIFYVTLPI